MTKDELYTRYYVTRVSSHSKGKQGGKKIKVRVVFNESRTRRDYLNDLESIDRKSCGMFLCRIEHDDMTSDRWWDVPTYRDDAIRDYRSRINGIRQIYGLSKSEVAEFMRVA